MSVASVKPSFRHFRAHRGGGAVAAGEAGGQQESEAVVDLREQPGDHQHPEQGGKGELDRLGQHFIGEVGAHPVQLRLELLLGEGEAVHAHGGKDQDDQRAGVVPDGTGEGQDIQTLVAQGQGDKAGNHAGGDKELLNQTHLGPDQLSHHNKERGNGKIEQKIVDSHLSSS